MRPPSVSCWIEIDLAALRANYAAIAALCPGTRLICVVKANAYGCGAVRCAQALEEAGAPYGAVARLEEALELRAGGIRIPLLLLGPLAPGSEDAAVAADLTPSIGDEGAVERLGAAARRAGKQVPVHIEIDTGMSRFGVSTAGAAALAKSVREQAGLVLEGVYTHFAQANDAHAEPSERQFAAFSQALETLHPLPPWCHCANSAALVRWPHLRRNAARPGTLLYGQFPSPVVASAARTAGMELRDVFTAKTRIIELRDVAQGDGVGYGSEWRAPRPSRIAIIACGWADGLTLEPRARSEAPWAAAREGLSRAARLMRDPHAGRMARWNGKRLPLIGRIGMQTSALDLTGEPAAAIGDEVIVPMRRVTAAAHLPRVYLL